LLVATASESCWALTTTVAVAAGTNPAVVIPQRDKGDHTITATPPSGQKITSPKATYTGLVKWTPKTSGANAVYTGKMLAGTNANDVWTVATLTGTITGGGGGGGAAATYTIPAYQAALDIKKFEPKQRGAWVRWKANGTAGRPNGNMDGTMRAGPQALEDVSQTGVRAKWKLKGSIMAAGKPMCTLSLTYDPLYPVAPKITATDVFEMQAE